MEKRIYPAVLFSVLTLSSTSALPKPANNPSANSAGANSSQSQTTQPQSSPAQPGSASTASFEAQMLAFFALDHVANDIANRTCKDIPNSDSAPRVVIYDQASFNNIMAYASFAQNLEIVQHDYEQIIANNALPGKPTVTATKGPGAAAAAAASGSSGASISLSPVSDFSGLLGAVAVATDTENYGSVIIPDSAMAVAVTKHLESMSCGAGAKPVITYPPIFGTTSASATLAQNVIDTLVKGVQADREKAHANVAATVTSFTGSVQAAQLQDVDQLYDTLLGTLTSSNPTTNLSGVASVIQGKVLSDLLAPPAGGGAPAYVVLASIVAAGGTEHDHTNLWRRLWKGDEITYSGGVIVEFAMWQAPTSQLDMDVIRYRVPSVEAAPPEDSQRASGFAPMAPSD